MEIPRRRRALGPRKGRLGRRAAAAAVVVVERAPAGRLVLEGAGDGAVGRQGHRRVIVAIVLARRLVLGLGLGIGLRLRRGDVQVRVERSDLVDFARALQRRRRWQLPRGGSADCLAHRVHHQERRREEEDEEQHVKSEKVAEPPCCRGVAGVALASGHVAVKIALARRAQRLVVAVRASRSVSRSADAGVLAEALPDLRRAGRRPPAAVVHRDRFDGSSLGAGRVVGAGDTPRAVDRGVVVREVEALFAEIAGRRALTGRAPELEGRAAVAAKLAALRLIRRRRAALALLLPGRGLSTARRARLAGRAEGLVREFARGAGAAFDGIGREIARLADLAKQAQWTERAVLAGRAGDVTVADDDLAFAGRAVRAKSLPESRDPAGRAIRADPRGGRVGIGIVRAQFAGRGPGLVGEFARSAGLARAIERHVAVVAIFAG